MKKCTPFLLLFLCAAVSSVAQGPGATYRTAIGLKLYSTGVTVKHFVGRRTALEGIGVMESDGFRLTGLFEWYTPIAAVDGMGWYIGPGLHTGLRSGSRKDAHPGTTRYVDGGIDGVFGFDYKIGKLPLNLSLDWQPSWNLVRERIFEARRGGLGLRYTF
jgi:hypothetical protein